MPALTTEAVILKRKNFGEADRVITAFSAKLGKISIIARGVRKITSRRAGNVEVLNIVKLHLFKSRNYILQEAQSLETFEKLKSNLTLSAVSFHIVELIDKLTVEEQPSIKLYQILKESLIRLEQSPRQIIIRALEIKTLSLLGFWSIDAITDVLPSIKDLLIKLEELNLSEIEKLEIEKEQALILETITKNYIEKIIEGSLKSIQVMKKIIN